MYRIVFIFFFVALLSCKDNKTGYVSKEENGNKDVYNVSAEDEEMNMAIQKATTTYPDFLNVLNNADSSVSGFSIKMRFEYEEGSGEHMWLSDLHNNKTGNLVGILESDPFYLEGMEVGDTLEIKKEQVSDWMYVRDNKLVGGYTIKALYNKMSEEERTKFREQLPFEIE